MGAEILKAISNFRFVLPGELDADSPDNEWTTEALRQYLDTLVLLLLGTGVTGTVTSITETVLTDSTKSWSTNEHRYRTLVITSGAATGNRYTIDANDSTSLTLTGDTLVSDGVQVGDDYAIVYDIKNNTDGHDHDGVNSREVVLPDGTVSAWSDDSEVSGSGGGYVTAKTIRIYYPGTFTRLTFAVELKAGSGDTAFCRLSDGSNASGQVSRNSTNYGWVNLSSSWDISGLGWTPGAWKELYIQCKDDYSSGWYIRGVNIVWANS